MKKNDRSYFEENSTGGNDFTLLLLIPLGIDLLLLIAICTLYLSNTVLTLAAASIFLFGLIFRYSGFKLILSVISMLFGTIGEILCCSKGIELWRYDNPTIWGIPIWLPLIWPVLMITFTEAAIYFHRYFTHTLKKESYVFLTVLLITIALIYSFYTIIHIHRVIASVFLVFIILMMLFARKSYYIMLFWIASLGGFIGEYICIRHHVWYYTRPFFSTIGIPLSLPLAWGLSAVIIVMLTHVIVKKLAIDLDKGNYDPCLHTIRADEQTRKAVHISM